MKPNKLAIAFLTLSMSQAASASSLNAEKLIKSCQEAVNIYSDKNAELNTYAALTTSLSEAFQGGYCAGALQAYLELNRSCFREDWLAKASEIAALDNTQRRNASVKNLLRNWCY